MLFLLLILEESSGESLKHQVWRDDTRIFLPNVLKTKKGRNTCVLPLRGKTKIKVPLDLANALTEYYSDANFLHLGKGKPFVNEKVCFLEEKRELKQSKYNEG